MFIAGDDFLDMDFCFSGGDTGEDSDDADEDDDVVEDVGDVDDCVTDLLGCDDDAICDSNVLREKFGAGLPYNCLRHESIVLRKFKSNVFI